jgi:hypothetical protein
LRPDLLREVYGTDVEIVRTADGRSVVLAAHGSAPNRRPSTLGVEPCDRKRRKSQESDP